jgi:hypothetical protein
MNIVGSGLLLLRFMNTRFSPDPCVAKLAKGYLLVFLDGGLCTFVMFGDGGTGCLMPLFEGGLWDYTLGVTGVC